MARIIQTRSMVVFACHSAACRPPTSGGTGGSSGKGGSGRAPLKGVGLANATVLPRGIYPKPGERAAGVPARVKKEPFPSAVRLKPNGAVVRGHNDLIVRVSRLGKGNNYLVGVTKDPSVPFQSHESFPSYRKAAEYANQIVDPNSSKFDPTW